MPDWDVLWFSVMGAFFFSLLVLFERTDSSSWRDIVAWGTGVYLTFGLLGPLNQFLHSDSGHTWAAFTSFSIRWAVFVFSIVLFTGIISRYRRRR